MWSDPSMTWLSVYLLTKPNSLSTSLLDLLFGGKMGAHLSKLINDHLGLEHDTTPWSVKGSELWTEEHKTWDLFWVTPMCEVLGEWPPLMWRQPWQGLTAASFRWDYAADTSCSNNILPTLVSTLATLTFAILTDTYSPMGIWRHIQSARRHLICYLSQSKHQPKWDKTTHDGIQYKSYTDDTEITSSLLTAPRHGSTTINHTLCGLNHKQFKT